MKDGSEEYRARVKNMVQKQHRPNGLEVCFRTRTRIKWFFFAEGEKQIYLQKTRYVSVNIMVQNSAMGQGMLYW